MQILFGRFEYLAADINMTGNFEFIGVVIASPKRPGCVILVGYIRSGFRSSVSMPNSLKFWNQVDTLIVV